MAVVALTAQIGIAVIAGSALVDAPGPVEPSLSITGGVESGSELPSLRPSLPTPEPTPTPAPAAAPTTKPSPKPTPAPAPKPTAAPTPVTIAVKLGSPTQRGRYSRETPVAAIGRYITWRAIIGAESAGETFDVEVALRLEGVWTGWAKLTSRVVDAEGALVFTWRQRSPTWVSVRFALANGPSRALQGRWR